MADKVILKCPHGHEIEARESFGLTSYVHTHNDELCEVMNSFDFECEKIVELIGTQHSNESHKSPIFIATFRNSAALRDSFYYKMSLEKDQERLIGMHMVVDDVLGISHLNDGKEDWKKYCRELSATFGVRFFHNLAIIHGDDQIYRYYCVTGNPVKYRIFNVLRTTVDNINKIKDELEKAAERKRVAIQRTIDKV